MDEKLNYYMNLPYTIEFQNDPEYGWYARVKELPGCMNQGDTPEEALEAILDTMQGWLEIALEKGNPIPEPRHEEDYSGKFVVRVPKSLHRKLVEESEKEGVSLNQYINVALAGSVAGNMAIPKKSAIVGSEEDINVILRQYMNLGPILEKLVSLLESQERMIRQIGVSKVFPNEESIPPQLNDLIQNVNRPSVKTDYGLPERKQVLEHDLNKYLIH